MDTWGSAQFVAIVQSTFLKREITCFTAGLNKQKNSYSIPALCSFFFVSLSYLVTPFLHYIHHPPGYLFDFATPELLGVNIFLAIVLGHLARGLVKLDPLLKGGRLATIALMLAYIKTFVFVCLLCSTSLQGYPYLHQLYQTLLKAT